MCGIVGYNGKNNSVNILLPCLKALEYNKYDSAGIAVNTDDNIVIIKSTGSVSFLEEKIKKFKSNFGLSGSIGIGHTRRATNGKPSNANAHPHSIGDITIVHNGIIENYEELRQKLINRGYFFKSETDTEVACALIDYYYYDCHDIIKSLSMFMDSVKGSYAISVMVNSDRNLYCIRNDAPLFIANGDDGNYIASDIVSIGGLVNKILYLDDGVIAKVGKDNICLFNKDLEIINPIFCDMSEFASQIDKNGYEYFILKEIHEQPKVLRKSHKFK